MNKQEIRQEKSVGLEEAAAKTLSAIEEELEVDGFTLIIQEKDLFYIYDSTGAWEELPSLPESLALQTLEEKTPLCIHDPKSMSAYAPAIDTAGASSVSSLLLCPLAVDESSQESVERILVSLWRVPKKEKEQVMVPLIVGNQMIGMTTRTKSKTLEKLFTQEDLQKICAKKEFFLDWGEKIRSLIQESKQAILNQNDQNSETPFSSPQEIIVSILNLFIGMKTSLKQISSIADELQKETPKSSRSFQKTTQLQALLSSLSGNVSDILRFTSQNEIIRQLLASKKEIQSLQLFENIFHELQGKTCEKKLTLCYYFNPAFPRMISLDISRFYSFLQLLLHRLLEASIDESPFELSFEQNMHRSMTMKVRTNLEEETPKNSKDFIQKLLETESDESEERWAKLPYRQFLEAGGRVDLKNSPDTEYISLHISFPMEIRDPRRIVETIDKKQRRVWILFDRAQEFFFANTVVKYLLNLGVSRTEMFAAEHLDLFQSEPTHIVAFESKIDAQSIQKLSSYANTKILVATNECSQLKVHDYSFVDYSIDSNELYLETLEEFIA